MVWARLKSASRVLLTIAALQLLCGALTVVWLPAETAGVPLKEEALELEGGDGHRARRRAALAEPAPPAT